MVTAVGIIYQPSDTTVAQGKNISTLEKMGYYKKQGGSGTYRMVKPSTVTLKYEVDGDGTIHSSSVKELIRDAYSISRVTEKQSRQFLRDVIDGKIVLDYSEENGLTLM